MPLAQHRRRQYCIRCNAVHRTDIPCPETSPETDEPSSGSREYARPVAVAAAALTDAATLLPAILPAPLAIALLGNHPLMPWVYVAQGFYLFMLAVTWVCALNQGSTPGQELHRIRAVPIPATTLYRKSECPKQPPQNSRRKT